MTKVYLLIIILGLLGSVGYAGYRFYTNTQTTISVLTKNNATLEAALNQSENAFMTYRDRIQQELEEYKEALTRQTNLTNNLNVELKKISKQNNKIARLLSETDIIQNSIIDPINSERKINEQIDYIFGAFRCATGDSTFCMQ